MAFRFICPYCNTESSIDDSLKGVEQECPACCENVILEPATEKNCPHCGKIIKINAKICRFCHNPVASHKEEFADFFQNGLTMVKAKTDAGIGKLKQIIKKKNKSSDIVRIDPASLFPASYITDNAIPHEVSEPLVDEIYFEFECPFCHNILNAEREWSGMEAECQICKSPIIIPKAPNQKNIGDEVNNHNPKKEKSKNKQKTIILISIIGALVTAGVIYTVLNSSAKVSSKVKEQRVNVTVNIHMKKIIPLAYVDIDKSEKHLKQLSSEPLRYDINIHLVDANNKVGKIIHTEKNIAYDYEMKDGIDVNVSVPKGKKIIATMQLTEDLRHFMRYPMNSPNIVLGPSEFSDITADKEGKKISVICDKFYKI